MSVCNVDADLMQRRSAASVCVGGVCANDAVVREHTQYAIYLAFPSFLHHSVCLQQNFKPWHLGRTWYTCTHGRSLDWEQGQTDARGRRLNENIKIKTALQNPDAFPWTKLDICHTG